MERNVHVSLWCPISILISYTNCAPR